MYSLTAITVGCGRIPLQSGCMHQAHDPLASGRAQRCTCPHDSLIRRSIRCEARCSIVWVGGIQIHSGVGAVTSTDLTRIEFQANTVAGFLTVEANPRPEKYGR